MLTERVSLWSGYPIPRKSPDPVDENPWILAKIPGFQISNPRDFPKIPKNPESRDFPKISKNFDGQKTIPNPGICRIFRFWSHNKGKSQFRITGIGIRDSEFSSFLTPTLARLNITHAGGWSLWRLLSFNLTYSNLIRKDENRPSRKISFWGKKFFSKDFDFKNRC